MRKNCTDGLELSSRGNRLFVTGPEYASGRTVPELLEVLKRSSFSRTTPLENMLRLCIPILYVAGGRDNNQTILSMDYAKLEFLRRGKANLTYRVYPDCNHYFQEEKTVEGATKNTDRLDEVQH